MSLIRKHRAVLQAWACLALVNIWSASLKIWSLQRSSVDICTDVLGSPVSVISPVVLWVSRTCVFIYVFNLWAFCTCCCTNKLVDHRLIFIDHYHFPEPRVSDRTVCLRCHYRTIRRAWICSGSCWANLSVWKFCRCSLDSIRSTMGRWFLRATASTGRYCWGAY